MSRIGKRPIAVPKSVKVNITNNNITVEGPKGKLEWKIPLRITAEFKDSQVILKRPTDNKLDKTLHGTARSIIANIINGVDSGYSKQLEIVGVGYRAQVSGEKLNMQIGFSHPIEYKIPKGVKAETPKPTIIVISGIDKAKVGQAAAEIRAFYKPEPYKGKGVRFSDEHVKRKAGKAVA